MQVALFEPDIPFNTGNVARTCLATNSTLHLIGRLGFQIDDRKLKRAGLDYFQHVRIQKHDSIEACIQSLGNPPTYYFSAHATRSYVEAKFQEDSLLVFGSETRGLPDSVLSVPEQCWTIPMFDDRIRSLNLSTSVAIVLYEALRQTGKLGVRP